MDKIQKTVTLPGGKRGTVALDEASWATIDWLAKRQGKTSRQWCEQTLAATPNPGNITALLRQHALDRLLHETIYQERAEAMSDPQPVGFSLAGVCNDADFNEAVGNALIEGSCDLTSVRVLAGIDEHGQVAFYVRNLLAECDHMVISTPFRPEEWLDRTGGVS